MMASTHNAQIDSGIHEHDARERLWALIKDIRFAMFTVRHANGHLHSRPMTTQNARVDEDTSLWFFMRKGSEPVIDLVRDPEVNIAYADVGADSYVSVSGKAAVVEDLAKKHELWCKLTEAWFPGGAGDPDLALVRGQHHACRLLGHARKQAGATLQDGQGNSDR